MEQQAFQIKTCITDGKLNSLSFCIRTSDSVFRNSGQISATVRTIHNNKHHALLHYYYFFRTFHLWNHPPVKAVSYPPPHPWDRMSGKRWREEEVHQRDG